MKFNKKSKNIGLVYRDYTDKAKLSAEELTAWLVEKGYSVFTLPEQKKIKGTELLKSDSKMKDLCLVVVLGGDGTYLRAVSHLNGLPIPVLGFNMGSLGFLTHFSSSEMYQTLGKTLNGHMEIRPRTLLEATVVSKNKKPNSFLALNDIVIERGNYSQLINTAIHCGKFFVSQVKADGLIIATPTGSTAYNLSAGGPLIFPEAKSIVLTSVAPHSLNSRPIIFSEESTLSFKLEGKSQKAHFVVDGQKKLEITNDEEVIIKKSKHNHWVFNSPTHNFFHLLREKLKFGERG